MSMDFFPKAVNCFWKEVHLRGLLDRLPKICLSLETHFMNTKTKTKYINYIHKLHKLNYIKLHLLLVFVKCALMTFISEWDAFIEANIYRSHGDPG